MIPNYVAMRSQALRFLTDWGETVTVKRIDLDYADSPPSDTWAQSGTPTLAIQSLEGRMARHDAGILKEATHWAMGVYNVDIVQGDLIFRADIDDYYLTIRVDVFDGHKEIWLKYVVGNNSVLGTETDEDEIILESGDALVSEDGNAIIAE